MTKRKAEKSTDDLQNGGGPTVEERIEKLEVLVAELIKKNCLLTPEDGR